MKKIIALVLVLAMSVSAVVMSVSAANITESSYTKDQLLACSNGNFSTANQTLLSSGYINFPFIDMFSGGGGNIQLVSSPTHSASGALGWYGKQYGVGNTEKGDQVVVKNIEFGTDGAEFFVVIASNAPDSVKNPTRSDMHYAIYLDSVSDENKIGTIAVPVGLGYDAPQAITAALDKTVTGTHTVIFEYQDFSGSFWGFTAVKQGVLKNGWEETDNGKVYYINGTIAQGFQVIDNATYYFNRRGVMQTGVQTISGKTYYFKEDGTMKTGWQEIEGVAKYFDEDGAMVMSSWKYVDGKYYYLGEDGAKATDISGAQFVANRYSSLFTLGK